MIIPEPTGGTKLLATAIIGDAIRRGFNKIDEKAQENRHIEFSDE